MADDHAPRSLDEFLSDLPDKLLLCRELGHTWKPYTATFDGRAYDRTLICPRCRTRRVQVLSTRGHIVSNRYAYPEGYLTHGLGRLDGDDRDALRLASVMRTSTPVVVPAAEGAA